jgi:uncharacterized protein YjbI with pentapeptide repeats
MRSGRAQRIVVLGLVGVATMANTDHLELLRQGVDAWNAWRRASLCTANLSRANLRGADLNRAELIGAELTRASLRGAQLSGAKLRNANLRGADIKEADLRGANLEGAELIGADLTQASLRSAQLSGAKLKNANLREADLKEADLKEADLNGANLIRANFSGAELIGADLTRASLSSAQLSGADLRDAKLRNTELIGADLTMADLTMADLTMADLYGANLIGADLAYARLVDADITNADLTGCRIYGVSAWGLKLNDKTKQRNLLITKENESEITVDNIEVAQFIYLLLHNEKIREVIDTITTKTILILGCFTSERKQVLDALRDELRKQDLLPIIFDFSIPESRDVTETVKVLAGLARFVIADITDATEVRVELHNILRDFISLPVQPILLRGQPEFISMQHLKKFPWLLPTFEYDSQEHLLVSLHKDVVGPAEAKALELRGGLDSSTADRADRRS